MKLALTTLVFLFSTAASAANLNFNFKNAEITSVIEAYAKATGQKFVIDPIVRGKISILLPAPVPTEEAFALMSSALATNSIAIVEMGDSMHVMSARNAQRSHVPTLTELPPLKPERMVTMIFTPKNIKAEDINRQLRILPSRDGELTPIADGNRIIVTDWVSNLHRIGKIIAEIDTGAGSAKK